MNDLFKEFMGMSMDDLLIAQVEFRKGCFKTLDWILSKYEGKRILKESLILFTLRDNVKAAIKCGLSAKEANLRVRGYFNKWREERGIPIYSIGQDNIIGFPEKPNHVYGKARREIQEILDEQ